MTLHFEEKYRMPVYSTARIKHMQGQPHALFDYMYIKNHGMNEKRWSLDDLIDNYARASSALKLRYEYETLCKQARRRNIVHKWQRLRKETRDGRRKLRILLNDSVAQKVKMYLSNHKDIQRLFANIPVHEMADRINERTFLLRKNRDRLQYRVRKLEDILKEKWLEYGKCKSKPELADNDLFSDTSESTQISNAMKKIENLTIRLRTFQLLNNTYKKILQILHSDCLFYQPILQSLEKDIEDQKTLTTYIIHCSNPAIQSKEKLKNYLDNLEKEIRHSISSQRNWTNKSKNIKRAYKSVKHEDSNYIMNKWLLRYERSTTSMLELNNDLRKVEKEIRLVGNATLASHPTTIYRTIKNTYDHIAFHQKNKALDEMRELHYNFKQNSADVIYSLTGSDFTNIEIRNRNKIDTIRKQIASEKQREKNLNDEIKKNANVFVAIRKSLWCMDETLKHVQKKNKYTTRHNPSGYLSWPLLRYDYLVMHALPPDQYEEDLGVLLHTVTLKTLFLMEIFHQYTNSEPVVLENFLGGNLDQYADTRTEDMWSIGISNQATESDEDDQSNELNDSRQVHLIPTNQSIKARSKNIVEENKKVDEMGVMQGTNSDAHRRPTAAQRIARMRRKNKVRSC